MLDKQTKNAIIRLLEKEIHDYNYGSGYLSDFFGTCEYEAILNRQDIYISFRKDLIFKDDTPIMKIKRRYGKGGKQLKPTLETI